MLTGLTPNPPEATIRDSRLKSYTFMAQPLGRILGLNSAATSESPSVTSSRRRTESGLSEISRQNGPAVDAQTWNEALATDLLSRPRRAHSPLASNSICLCSSLRRAASIRSMISNADGGATARAAEVSPARHSPKAPTMRRRVGVKTLPVLIEQDHSRPNCVRYADGRWIPSEMRNDAAHCNVPRHAPNKGILLRHGADREDRLRLLKGGNPVVTVSRVWKSELPQGGREEGEMTGIRLFGDRQASIAL